MFGTPRNAYDCQQGRTLCNSNAVDFSQAGLTAPFSLIADGSFSLRFSEMVRAPDTSQSVTFTTAVRSAAAQDERAKLWIDNSLLMDQWTWQPASVATASRLTLTPNQLYDIKLEYKNVVSGSTDGANLALKWGWNGQAAIVVPSTKLFSSHTLSGTFKRVCVNLAVAFNRACEVHGAGLTLSTAGIQGTFLIQAKDAYNNRRGIGGDLFMVRAFSYGCQTLNPGRDALCDGFRGTVKPDGTIPADVNIACSDKATCAPCPPQVPSNGPNLLGNLILGDSYLGETRGLSLAQPKQTKLFVVSTLNSAQVVLGDGELSSDHAYVGATITFSAVTSSCAINGSKTIVGFSGGSMMATLDSPLASSVTNDCKYAISSSNTVLYLAHASHVHSSAGHYDQYRIRFLSGSCMDRWTTGRLSASAISDTPATDVTEVMEPTRMTAAVLAEPLCPALSSSFLPTATASLMRAC